MPTLHAVLKRLCAVAPVLTLVACAQPVTPYVAPAPSAASARLMMRNALAGPDSYEVDVFDDAESCGGKQRVGTGNQNVNPKTTTIAAGHWETIEVVVSKPGRLVYHVRWSFMPAAGRSYLLSTSSKAGGCSAIVLDATNPDSIRIEPSLRRRNVGSNACVPIARANPIRLTDQHDSGDTSDLPIAPENPAPAAPKPPATKATAPKAAPAVTVDDLQGLIGN
jgi:hypothetical protein